MGELNILQKCGILILDILMTRLQMLKDLFYIEKPDLNRKEKYLLFLESILTQNSYRSKPCIRGQWQRSIRVQKILLEKPAISLPLANSMYEMDISCNLVLLLTLIYILYQLHYQQILQRIIDSEYNSVTCILNLIIGFCRFYGFRTFTNTT